jgi:glycosyltransferase involved in cell wall biosynthesis
MTSDSKPLVSICCITYNHESFIRSALEGFLLQQTDFPIEILVRDDASTDGTAAIIRDYQRRYPGLIKPILEQTNQFSRGVKPLPFLLRQAQSEFIAVCEGDDYWTDPHKLQKQIDYLRSHPDVILTAHAVRAVDSSGNSINHVGHVKPTKSLITQQDMAYGEIPFPTASVVFRNIFEIPHFTVLAGDAVLFTLSSNFGNAFFFRETMGVYRVHHGGVWSGLNILARQEESLKTKAFLPNLVIPQHKSLAYLNLFRFTKNSQLSLTRKVFWMSLALFKAVIWLRPVSMRYLISRLNHHDE